MGFISIAHNLKLGFLCYKENFSEDGGLHRGIGFVDRHFEYEFYTFKNLSTISLYRV